MARCFESTFLLMFVDVKTSWLRTVMKLLLLANLLINASEFLFLSKRTISSLFREYYAKFDAEDATSKFLLILNYYKMFLIF